MSRPLRLRDRLLVACFIVMCLLGQWRFGGVRLLGSAPGPPDDPEFGPINGRQWVIDHAVPIQPSQPGGAIQVPAGSFTQTTLNNGGSGAVFWLLAGTHSLAGSLAPLTNQQIWCAAGAVIDGGNGPLNSLIASGASGVQIHGGTWQNEGDATSATFAAAILCTAGFTSNGWIVEDARITENFNRGICFQASNCRATRCEIDNNGRYGMCAASNEVGQTTAFSNIVYENIHQHENNTRGLDTGFAAGGSKFTHAEVIVRDSYSHNDHGFSLWWDLAAGLGYGNGGAIGCVAENNDRSGIFLEGVAGGAFCIRNFAKNNGSDTTVGGNAPTNTNNAQIRVTDSDTTLGTGVAGLVERNDVDYTRSPTTTDPGWLFILWNHNGHPDRCKNWQIKHNRFWCRTSQTNVVGGHENATSGTELWVGNNVFTENTYMVLNTSTNYWKWDTGTGIGVAQTWSAWQGFGHDATGTRIVIT